MSKILKNIDFAKKDRFKLSGEKLDDYCHVISETFDKIVSENKYGGYTLSKDSINEMSGDGKLNDVFKTFSVQKELNSKLWVNGKLNSRVRLRLLDIADKFFDSFEVNWVKPDDIILTGSIANYNWSKYSDIDLHIVIDFSKVDKRTEFVKDYFDSKKTIWNENHENLKIYGFPVEIYVQDKNEKHTSSGIYSLEKNEWLKEPERDELEAVKLDKEKIVNKSADIIRKIESFEKTAKTEKDTEKVDILSKKVKELFDKIKGLRKDSLAKGGEMSFGNVVFKILRRLGYIGRLVDLKSVTYDKINSLNESNFVDYKRYDYR